MKIAPATIDDIDDIATLHLFCLPETQSSRMGKPYLMTLYRSLLQNRDLHILLTATINEKIIGTITLSKNLSETQRIMTQSLIPWGLPTVITSLLRRKISLFDLLEKMKFERALSTQFSHPYVSILTLFVDKQFQKNGFGKKLIEESTKILQRQKISTLFVDTQQTNTGALAFYKKAGFKECAHIFDSVVLSKKI